MKLKWNVEPPEFSAKPCLVTIKREDGSRYITDGWAGFGEMMKGAIAWAEYPDFSKSKEGWKSEYMGDEKPTQNGIYLVTLMKRNTINFPPEIYWYDCKKDTFGGTSDAIAWMDVPKPYSKG